MYVYTKKVRVRVKSKEWRQAVSRYRCARYLLVIGLGGEEVEVDGRESDLLIASCFFFFCLLFCCLLFVVLFLFLRLPSFRR